jgi:heme A synthase
MARRLLPIAAVVGFVSLASGAFITSSKVALQPGEPEPSATVHRAVALVTVAIVLVWCVSISTRKSSTVQRIAGWSAFISISVSGVIGWTPPLSPATAVWHTLLAHLFTACIAIAALSVETTVPGRIAAGQWKFLRPASLMTPFAAYCQILFGALYRHQITGIMPHMLGAMIVALLALVVSAIVLQNFTESRDLKAPATLLIALVLVQVLLGITVFIMLLLNVSNTPAFVWIATSHVSVGTLVLAASVFMAIRIRRTIDAGS